MQRFYIAFILLFSTSCLWAQDIQDEVQTLVENYVSQNEDENMDIELLYETFLDLCENPININAASFSDLELLPFLAPHHINALLDYKKRHGQFISKYDLQGVYDFDRNLIEKIVPFISFGEVESTYKRKMYMRNEILLRSNTVVEKQEGFTRPDTVSRYLGPNASALLKYKGSLGKKYSWHITAEQDRGEPYFYHTKLSDFSSIGMQYTGDKWLKNVIVGDYRMCFGQGLVLNNNFGYGKSSQVLDVVQKGKELNRFTSTSESLMLRGAATHLKFGDFDLYLGVSSRRADASIDSTENGNVITSFSETGLHRTESEIAKYKAAFVNDAAAHLDYRINNLKIGTTFTHQNLSHPFQKEESMYNFYVPKYENYFNASVDYKWYLKGVLLFGELAADKQCGVAGLQGVIMQPSSRVSMSVVYRNFSEKYFSFYGQGFGEGSSINNEEGLYFGTNIAISKDWSLDTYFDWYRFPWLRYGVQRPTSGYDILFQPNYAPTRETSMHWRIKYEEKEDNLKLEMPTNGVQNTKRLELRYHLKTKVTDHIYLQSRIATSHALHLKNEHGFLIYQDINTKLLKETLNLTLRYSLYNTSSYESRIYVYESDVLYLSSIPAFSGKGQRAYLNASYKLNDTFTFYLKTSISTAFDKETLSSGLDAIDGNHKTDIHLQLRIKL